MQETAAAQAVVLTTAEPRLARNRYIDRWSEEEVDQLIRRFDTWPCPALDNDGSCGLYESRPLVCRSMGIPSDDEGSVSGACVVQSAVPLIRLSNALREEEHHLAGLEATMLETLRHRLEGQGEELFLPFAFLPDNPKGPINESA